MLARIRKIAGSINQKISTIFIATVLITGTLAAIFPSSFITMEKAHAYVPGFVQDMLNSIDSSY